MHINYDAAIAEMGGILGKLQFGSFAKIA